jgi:hypothetical protein
VDFSSGKSLNGRADLAALAERGRRRAPHIRMSIKRGANAVGDRVYSPTSTAKAKGRPEGPASKA